MKYSTVKALILSVSLFPLIGYAQQNKKLDSLVQLYKLQKKDTIKANLIDDIIVVELYSRPVVAKRYAKELIELSKEIKYPKGEAKGYHRLAGYHIYQDELDSAELYYQKSLDINSRIKNLEGILSDNEQFALLHIRKNNFDQAFEFLNKNVSLFNARDTTLSLRKSAFNGIGGTFHTLSSAYVQKGMYRLALKNELIALQLYKESKGPLYVADAQNSLGVVELNLGNPKKAISYFEPALKTYQEFNDIHFSTLTLHNLGICYDELNQHEKAKKYYLKSIELANGNNYVARAALTHNNLGNLYLKINNKNEATKSFEKSISLYKSLDYPPEINAPYFGLGKLYNQFDQPNRALSYLNLAIKISDSTGQIKTAANAYRARYETYKTLQNYSLAANDLEKHLQLKDSMYNETKSQQIEEMRAIFDTEKKEQQIAKQETEIDLLEEQEKVSTLQKLVLGGGLGLSLMALGFGFYGFRQKAQRNRIEKEKIEAELAFKKKELTTHALHLAKKNEILEQVKQKAKELKSLENVEKGYQTLVQTINFDQQDDKAWENFTQYFEAVHKDFAKQAMAKYPNITKNELRLMALMKMNLSSKEIANILNISSDGVKKARQRLRKKMSLSPEDSLETTVMAI